MKRAKSNEEIVEEFFNRRPFSTPPDDGLKLYIRRLLDALVQALIVGNASAPQQKKAGKLLRALASKRRGCPKQ